MMNKIIPSFPIIMPDGEFSLSWTGLDPQQENGFQQTYYGQYSNNTTEALHYLKHSFGCSQNMIIADIHNNIAYGPTGHYPIRVHPQLGYRISRGWIAENEWQGFYSQDDKPILLNPKKGYIVAANNPVTSPNVKNKIGVYTVGRARANRLNELIEDLIKNKSGKIEYSDMIQILNDTKDVFAEIKKSYMINIVKQELMINQYLNTTELSNILSIIEKWNSHFDKDMIEPIYFSTWEYFFIKNFLNRQLPDFNLKMKFMSSYIVQTFYLNFYKSLSEDLSYKSNYCHIQNEDHWRTSNTKIDSCASLLVLSLNQTIEYINSKFSKSEMVWGNLHRHYYKNNPFGQTPLRYFFDRSTPAAGNHNTINMGEYLIWDIENSKFRSMYSANLKLIAELGVSVHYSVDTGNSDNIFLQKSILIWMRDIWIKIFIYCWQSNN